ncbi:cohesin complex subunit SCC1 [Angomonas deanei]|nr:cohesin complex subunit SCC1 [Angomonas deanei]|eukprot:EPY20520.1 cohesin complex subunit SCC1 [Angomonas deanei]
MFFSTYVLTKKGPLAKVWLAAHWDRRLTRNEVKVVDLNQTIVHIVHPVVPIALRTSGELLVGVVRIYALKVRHLLKEATEATLFLRVTTTTGKPHGANSASVTHVGPDGVEKTTTLEGVLVGNKGDLEAVTFDLADKNGGGPQDAAEALAEARFDVIADLLHGKNPSGHNGEQAPLNNAWYAVEPTSQPVEELHNTQQDYDEIAKMRADLMAFGERASGSSKSKSSLSSIEKGRGSMVGDVPYPPVGDELDIGVPLPVEELPIGAGMDHEELLLTEDPFTVPEVLPVETPSNNRAKRARPVNVLDLDATVLPRETIDGNINDRSDIVNGEPRRGPMNGEEERDRFTIAGTANPTDPIVSAVPTSGVAPDLLSFLDTAPLCEMPNNALRVLYATTLQQSVAEAVEEAMQLSQGAQGRLSELPMGGMEEELPPVQEAPQREREETVGPKGLSTTTVHTLERVRDQIAAHHTSRKRGRSSGETPLEELVGKSCLFKDVASGLHRRDAARTFVEVLALASLQMIGAQQNASTKEVELVLRKEAEAILASS